MCVAVGGRQFEGGGDGGRVKGDEFGEPGLVVVVKRCGVAAMVGEDVPADALEGFDRAKGAV